MIIQNCKEFLEKNNLSNKSILIGFSGGVDSTALLFALNNISKEFNLKIAIAHINYNLRDLDSIKDEEFVKSVARFSNIPIYIHNTFELTNKKSKIEELARDIRNSFFEKILETDNFDYIALAHNQNDQAETLLFRLTRGTGSRGAVSMLPITKNRRIRPLLGTSRDEIKKWLIDNSISWREDKTNSESIYSRNILRNEVFPKLSEINSSVIKHFAHFTELLGAQNRELELVYNDWLDKNTVYKNVDNLIIKNKKPTFSKSLIYHLLTLKGIVVSKQRIEELDNNWFSTGTEHLLPNGWSLIILKRLIVLTKNKIKFLSYKQSQFLLKDISIEFTHLYKLSTSLDGYFKIPKSYFPLNIIPLHKCDEFDDKKRLIKKLKKRGLSKFERDAYPVVYSNSFELLWIPRFKYYVLDCGDDFVGLGFSIID